MNAWVKRWLGQVTPLFYLCAFVMVSSLLLGGGTRPGFVSDAILQFVAIPLLLFALWKLFEVPLTRQARAALLFCAAIAVLPLLQLVPLPPWLWTALPGRATLVTGFQILGGDVRWMPISVAPQATWLSALSLIPPVAIFVGTLPLAHRERRLLSLVVLAVGIVSVFVGLIQVAQGPESPWRFFEITNPTEAVGFFANRNHYAALLYALILLAAAWTVNATVSAGAASPRKELNTAPIVASIAGFTLLVVLLAGEAMARSRAGLGLTIVALFGAFALSFSDRRVGPGITPNKVLFGAVTLAIVFSVQYALYRILERFDVDPLQDARIDFVRHTVEAARAYMPVGSGLGTFVPVYALFETPEGTLANTYANHAHNDVLEVWLETGVLGIALMGLFAFWFVLRTVQIWRSAPAQASEIDWSLARAATIVVGLVVAHSFVDYPLRTGAMMAIMAFACALMIEPPCGVGDHMAAPSMDKRARHRRTHRPEPVPSAPYPISPRTTKSPAARPPLPGGRWGSNIEWPEEWSDASKSRPGSRKPKQPGSSDPSGN